MQVKEVMTSATSIVTNDGYVLTRLQPVDNYEEVRSEIMDEELTSLEKLYTNVCVFPCHSSFYVTPEDVGLKMTGGIAKKASECGVEIKSRPAANNPDVSLVDLSSTSDVAATLAERDIQNDEDYSGTYYFICLK